jgi:hypothetical protein
MPNLIAWSGRKINGGFRPALASKLDMTNNRNGMFFSSDKSIIAKTTLQIS